MVHDDKALRLTMLWMGSCRLASDPPRLVTSQDDGRIDVWDASIHRPLPPRRLQSVHIPTVLGLRWADLPCRHPPRSCLEIHDGASGVLAGRCQC